MTEATFEPKTGGENISEVKRVLEKLEREGLTIENIDEINNKIENTRMVIKTQQENAYTNYNEAYQEWLSKKDEEVVKKSIQNNIIPLTVYKDLFTMVQNAKEMISWYIFNDALQSQMMEKQRKLLLEIKPTKVLGQTLAEMKTWQKENYQFQKEQIDAKISNIEKMMMTSFQQINDNNLILNKENTRLIIDGDKEKWDMLNKVIIYLYEVIKILKADQAKDREIIAGYEKDIKEKQQTFITRIKEKEEERRDAKLQIPELPKSGIIPTREAKVTSKGNDLVMDKDEEVNFDEF